MGSIIGHAGENKSYILSSRVCSEHNNNHHYLMLEFNTEINLVNWLCSASFLISYDHFLSEK